MPRPMKLLIIMEDDMYSARTLSGMKLMCHAEYPPENRALIMFAANMIIVNSVILSPSSGMTIGTIVTASIFNV